MTVSQLGSQLWLMKRAMELLREASIISKGSDLSDMKYVCRSASYLRFRSSYLPRALVA